MIYAIIIIIMIACCLVDFAIPTDHRWKIKIGKKRNKYLDFARELRKLWNMRVKVIPVLVGTLGTVYEGLEREPEALEIREQIETI